MVSSKDILSKTGLKNIKTLTRWYKAGIIPEPLISTHPSGRGKIAYWPDWVLDHCIRLVELQKQGHSLRSALMIIDLEKITKTLNDVKEEQSFSEILENKPIIFKDGQSSNFLDIFIALILQDLKQYISDPGLLNTIINKMKDINIIKLTIKYVCSGYNPVLRFDGSDIDITTDFLVGHDLSYKPQKGNIYIVMQLLGPLKKTFSLIGIKFPDIPEGSLAHPAPKIWAKNKDLFIEYGIYLGGELGFEVIRETAKVVGKSDNEFDEPDKND